MCFDMYRHVLCVMRAVIMLCCCLVIGQHAAVVGQSGRRPAAPNPSPSPAAPSAMPVVRTDLETSFSLDLCQVAVVVQERAATKHDLSSRDIVIVVGRCPESFVTMSSFYFLSDVGMDGTIDSVTPVVYPAPGVPSFRLHRGAATVGSLTAVPDAAWSIFFSIGPRGSGMEKGFELTEDNGLSYVEDVFAAANQCARTIVNRRATDDQRAALAVLMQRSYQLRNVFAKRVTSWFPELDAAPRKVA